MSEHVESNVEMPGDVQHRTLDMNLHWVVLNDGENEKWIQSRWFKGEYSEYNRYVVIYNETHKIKLTGQMAQDFWEQLFVAKEEGRKTIYLKLNCGEMEEILVK